MSQRFYVTPVELADLPYGGQAYRPALPDGASFSAIMPTNPDGTPRLPFVICVVDTDDHDAVTRYNSNTISLGLTPESPMSDVRQNMRSQFTNRLRQNGYDITIDWQRDTAQDVFDKLAAIAEPAYKRGAVGVGQR